jgi:hypothetical protein
LENGKCNFFTWPLPPWNTFLGVGDMMHYAWMMTHLHTQNREQIQVKTGNSGHKWLGCILDVGRANRSSLDLQHHLQAASRAFFAHKQILCGFSISLLLLLLCQVVGIALFINPIFAAWMCYSASCFVWWWELRAIWIGLVPGTKFGTSGTWRFRQS